MRARWSGFAATYVGAVVGAGFASGREVLHFFAAYGRPGLYGAWMAGLLFAALGAIALHRIASQRHRHYGSLLRDVCGLWLGAALDRVAFVCLFVGLAAVIAGAGSLGTALLGWPHWPGCMLMGGALAASALGGPGLYVRFNTVAAPLILVGCLWAGLTGLHGAAPVRATPAMPIPWPAAAVLYVGYNLLLAIAGLCAAASADDRPSESAAGGVVGGLILGAACWAATAAMLPDAQALATRDLPLGLAVPHVLWQAVYYPFMLMLALWTTGAASALALGQRCQPQNPSLIAAAAAIAAAPVALVGLGAIVSAAYPVAGYAGAPLLVGLAAVPLRTLLPWQGRRRWIR